MEREVKFLRAASDRTSGHLVVYYADADGIVHKFETPKALAEVQQKMAGTLDTLRYLKGDLAAQPSEDIVHTSDASEAFFYEEMTDDYLHEIKEAFLKNLPEDYQRLDELAKKLQQLEIAHEAGILGSDGKEFIELVNEHRRDLGIW